MHDQNFKNLIPDYPVQSLNGNPICHSAGFCYTPCELVTSLMPDVARACFRAKKILEGIVYDTVYLEGNPFTFPEVKTLLEGITVGGHRLSDERQVVNQAKSWKTLLNLVETGLFDLSKNTFCRLHGIVAEEEALEWGNFRTGSVSIAGTEHVPPPSDDLGVIFDNGVAFIKNIENPHEKGMLFYLFGSLHQFFWDGNKRTSRLMMNGILLSSGFDIINIPAKKRLEFNEKMLRFYDSHDGSEMISFLASCSLDATLQILGVKP